MKAKKIVIILIAIAVLGGGLFLFQKDKQDKALVAHNKKKFERVLAAAKKNSAAGIQIMASAINKYHKEKGHYPKTLLNLYPEFIPERSVITTLNWKYYPEEKTFLLKRSLPGQTLYSAMGPEMKLVMRREGDAAPAAAVASSRVKTRSSLKTRKVAGTTTQLKSPSSLKTLSAPVAIKTIKVPTAKKETMKMQPEPEITMVKKALDRKEKFLLSFKDDRFYIWKTRDGIIGFSDIQYPEKEKVTIYKDKSWVEYQVGKKAGNVDNLD